jgi:hypothetical protein
MGLIDERFTLARCSSPRTIPARRPPTQFSAVLVAAATDDFLDRVQQLARQSSMGIPLNYPDFAIARSSQGR